MSDEPQFAYSDEEWQQRLRAAVEATVAARTRRKNERAVLAENRNWGLAQRHAAKLARLKQADPASNPCHSPTEPQVTATPPDMQTGENDLNRSHP